MINIGNNFYLVKLSFREYCKRIFSENPWMMASNYLYLQYWKPEFDPSKKQIRWQFG